MQSREGKLGSDRLARVVKEAFQAFWARYPKRKARQDALKAWIKLNPDTGTVQAIHTALDWQLQTYDWRKDGGQYVPLAATYLRGARWEDEPDEGTVKVYTPDYCQHEPRCHSRTWHAAKEQAS